MQSDQTATTGPARIPLSLSAFAVVYGGMLVAAGVLAFKLVQLSIPGLPPLAVPGGVFAILLTVITVDATAELHGRKVAQRMVWLGFVPLVLAIGLMHLVAALPAAHGWDGQAAAEAVFTSSARIIFASIIAYGVSQTLDVTIFTWLRGRHGVQALWLRAMLAALVAQTTDTLIFITISYYGVFPLLPAIGGQLIAKMLIAFSMIPLLYLAVWAGRRMDGASVHH